MVFLSEALFTSAFSQIAHYRQIIVDYLATRQIEDKGHTPDKDKGQDKDKGSAQDKDNDKDKGKSSLKRSEKDQGSEKGKDKDTDKDKGTTPKSTLVVVPLPYPHTLISMALTVWAASTCLRRISALTASSDPTGQDQSNQDKNNQGKDNNKGQGSVQDKVKRATTTTSSATATTTASIPLALAPPLISDRPLPPLLLLLADLTRATLRYKAPSPYQAPSPCSYPPLTTPYLSNVHLFILTLIYPLLSQLHLLRSSSPHRPHYHTRPSPCSNVHLFIFTRVYPLIYHLSSVCLFDLHHPMAPIITTHASATPLSSPTPPTTDGHLGVCCTSCARSTG